MYFFSYSLDASDSGLFRITIEMTWGETDYAQRQGNKASFKREAVSPSRPMICWALRSLISVFVHEKSSQNFTASSTCCICSSVKLPSFLMNFACDTLKMFCASNAPSFKKRIFKLTSKRVPLTLVVCRTTVVKARSMSSASILKTRHGRVFAT